MTKLNFGGKIQITWISLRYISEISILTNLIFCLREAKNKYNKQANYIL